MRLKRGTDTCYECIKCENGTVPSKDKRRCVFEVKDCACFEKYKVETVATGELDSEQNPILAKKYDCEACPPYNIRHPNYKFGCMRQQCSNKRSHFGPQAECYACQTCPTGMQPRIWSDDTRTSKYLPALVDQNPMQECEWIRPECACTDFITYDEATGYKCEPCGDRETRDPANEGLCITKTCVNQVMGTRNECYACMDCQKGAHANENGECEKLVCDHNKSPFETCQIQVHCGCDQKMDELAPDDARVPFTDEGVYSFEFTETEPEEGPDGTPVIGDDGK
jgi:hypothetical protein